MYMYMTCTCTCRCKGGVHDIQLRRKIGSKLRQLFSQIFTATTTEEKMQLADSLIDHLDRQRKASWISAVTNVDMKHSSRQAWSTLNKLTGRKHNRSSGPTCAVSPNAVASCLVSNGKFKHPDRSFTKAVNVELRNAWNAPTADANLTSDFTLSEIASAVKALKSGKAPGPDKLHPEFFLNMHPNCLAWLASLFSTCLKEKAIPKLWRKAKVVAILKPNKPPDSPSSYRPISLLCIAFKLLERLILNRIEPYVEDSLPNEQAGFRRGRTTVDQVVLLAGEIEESFKLKEKTGAAFIGLSAAYDTIWHRGLTLKLLQTRLWWR